MRGIVERGRQVKRWSKKKRGRQVKRGRKKERRRQVKRWRRKEWEIGGVASDS